MPLFAVELVGDWVRRNQLRVGGGGFELVPGASIQVPDNLRELWSERLERAVDGLDADARRALDLAAVLGSNVETDQLRRAMLLLHGVWDPTLIDTLTERGLVAAAEGELTFHNPMLRDVIAAALADTDEGRRLHRTCAALLLGPAGPRGHAAAARRADHLIAAGELRDAAESLRDAARGYRSATDFAHALRLLDEHDGLLDALAADDYDRRRAEANLIRADVLRLQWEFGQAAAAAQRALTPATRLGWPGLRAEALAMLSHVCRQRGDRDQALDHATEAGALFSALGNDIGVAQSLLSRAILARVGGDPNAARQHYVEAQRMYSSSGEPRGAANCALGLGHIGRDTGNTTEARRFYELARDAYEELAERNELANAINGLAEVARLDGDLETAEAMYAEALELQETVGSKGANITRLNLTIVELRRGAYDAASRRLDSLERSMRATHQTAFLPYVHVFRLVVLAGLGQFDDWDAEHARALASIETTDAKDRDLEAMAQLAAELAQVAGQRDIAAAAWAIARGQALGRQPQ